MPDYVYERAGWLVVETVTAEQAQVLYDEAAKLDGSELNGDLRTGFRFWSTVEPDGTKLIYCSVIPLTGTDEQPE